MKPLVPEITELPAKKMATVTSKGDPNTAAEAAMGATSPKAKVMKTIIRYRVEA